MGTQGQGHDSGVPRTAGGLALLVIIAVLAVGAIGVAGGSIASASPAPEPAALPGTTMLPAPPLTLPHDAGTSGNSTPEGPRCDTCGRWIIGGIPGNRTGQIAARHGAVAVNGALGIYRIERPGATGFARALKRAGLLAFAEPDVPARPAGYPDDYFAGVQDWLGQIVNPLDTTPPIAGPGSPLIGLVEKAIEPSHPDLAEANLTGAVPIASLTDDSHGTSVAGIIGSPGEGAGIRGVWPGARMRHFPLGGTCTTAANAIISAARTGAAVINMSYVLGSCYTHYLATQYAVSRDVLLVAAAGNDHLKGNPVLYPAADPHVISVGAVNTVRANTANTPTGEGCPPPALDLVACFSTRNRFVDISAPGAAVLAPVLIADPEPRKTAGWKATWNLVSGTSFAAPMVSAAAAWLRQIHPGWSALQVSGALTSTATDAGAPGRDPEYGTGLLNIDAALLANRAPDDPMEPNDDIPILRGTAGIPKANYLWRPQGRRVVKLRATLSRAKDPADVYRIRIPARKRILVKAAQLDGDIAITALKPSTRTLGKTRGKVIVNSDRPFPKTEGIKIRNLRRKAANIWLVVSPGRHASTDYSAYRLTIRRAR